MSNIPVRTLNDGNKIPVVGLGTWKANSVDVYKAVKHAINLGYRHFDCAYSHKNEREIGKAITHKIADGVVTRNDLFITNKLWNTFHEPELVEPTVRMQLKTMNLKYFDLYLMQSPVGWKNSKQLVPLDQYGDIEYSGVDFLDTWQAMEELIGKGLVRSIGVANFSPSNLKRLITNCRIPPANNQIECNLYLSNSDTLFFCLECHIAVTAYSPLGCPDRPWAQPQDTKMLDDPELVQIAQMYKKTPAQIVLKYLVQCGLIVIPKSINYARIRENINIFDFYLSQNATDTLSRLSGKKLYQIPEDILNQFYNPDKAEQTSFNFLNTDYSYTEGEENEEKIETDATEETLTFISEEMITSEQLEHENEKSEVSYSTSENKEENSNPFLGLFSNSSLQLTTKSKLSYEEDLNEMEKNEEIATENNMPKFNKKWSESDLEGVEFGQKLKYHTDDTDDEHSIMEVEREMITPSTPDKTKIDIKPEPCENNEKIEPELPKQYHLCEKHGETIGQQLDKYLTAIKQQGKYEQLNKEKLFKNIDTYVQDSIFEIPEKYKSSEEIKKIKHPKIYKESFAFTDPEYFEQLKKIEQSQKYEKIKKPEVHEPNKFKETEKYFNKSKIPTAFTQLHSPEIYEQIKKQKLPEKHVEFENYVQPTDNEVSDNYEYSEIFTETKEQYQPEKYEETNTYKIDEKYKEPNNYEQSDIQQVQNDQLEIDDDTEENKIFKKYETPKQPQQFLIPETEKYQPERFNHFIKYQQPEYQISEQYDQFIEQEQEKYKQRNEYKPEVEDEEIPTIKTPSPVKVIRISDQVTEIEPDTTEEPYDQGYETPWQTDEYWHKYPGNNPKYGNKFGNKNMRYPPRYPQFFHQPQVAPRCIPVYRSIPINDYSSTIIDSYDTKFEQRYKNYRDADICHPRKYKIQNKKETEKFPEEDDQFIEFDIVKRSKRSLENDDEEMALESIRTTRSREMPQQIFSIEVIVENPNQSGSVEYY